MRERCLLYPRKRTCRAYSITSSAMDISPGGMRLLLRMRSERPYRRTAENRDELASLHASSGEDHGKT